MLFPRAGSALLALLLSVPAPAEPELHKLAIDTRPGGVRVYLQTVPEPTLLAGTAEATVVDLQGYRRDLSRGGTPGFEDVPLILRKRGYLDQRITVKSDDWAEGRYPKTVQMTPTSPLYPILDGAIDHPFLLLLGVGGVGLAGIVLRRLRPAPALDPDTLVGRTFGGYKLLSPLGEGGAAQVFLGARGQERVAVKILRPQGEEDFERFRREVEVTRRLDHPHIVRLFAYGEEHQRAFVVLELMEGGRLREHLRGAHAPAEARRLLEPIFSAVAAAHGLGVVHRDLKPENILVSQSGVLKVADFGLAKAVDTKSLTRTSAILGTPAYMAPEQIQGASREASIDQYALGVLAYEVLAGHLPFDGADPVQLIFKHLSDAPPEVEGMPAAVLRMLAKSPQDRFPSVQEAWNELAQSLP